MDNNDVKKDVSGYVEPINNIFDSELFKKLQIIDKDEHLERTLDAYEKCMNDGKLLKVTVMSADNHGNLHVPISNDIIGIIPNEEVFGKTYDFRKRSAHVGKKFPVIVTEVDKENNRVYFSVAKAREKAKEIIKNNLKPGMIVSARVMFVSEKTNRVYIDIEGYNILGYIPIKQWTHGYIYNPESKIKKGMIINVQILRYKPYRGEGLNEVFECSRKNTLPNPWAGIEERFPKNSILEVVATDLHPDKWFAPIPGLDLDIYCEYPRNNPSNVTEQDLEGYDEYTKMDIEQQQGQKLIIKLGHTYKVRVYKVSEKDRLLKARPITEVIK